MESGEWAFVTGTDPELMLLIEARRTGEGYEWQYATGRFTDLPLKFRHKQQVLWSREYERGTEDDRDPYFTTRTGQVPKEID